MASREAIMQAHAHWKKELNYVLGMSVSMQGDTGLERDMELIKERLRACEKELEIKI